MKRIIIILAFLICGIVSAQNPAYFFNGRVDVPRTTAQILATASPVEGLAFMSSDTGTIWYYDGSVWKDSGNPLIDASGFSGNLTTSVVDLQLLAEAVDSLTISGGGGNVPSGGTTGQILAKASGTDYDTEWVDQSGGIVAEGITPSIGPGGTIITHNLGYAPELSRILVQTTSSRISDITTTTFTVNHGGGAEVGAPIGWAIFGGDGATPMTGSEIVSSIDSELGGTDWQTGGTPTTDASDLTSGTLPDARLSSNALPPTVSQNDAEAGTSTSVYRWTPQRVAQAIAALADALDPADQAKLDNITISNPIDLDALSTSVTDKVSIDPNSPIQSISVALADTHAELENAGLGTNTIGFSKDGGSGGGGASQLSDLSDVGSSTPTNRNVLVADGVDWESRPLVEDDISDFGTYLESIVQGTNITIDNTDPQNPIISGSGGLPNGGTTGQVLAKASSTNQDVEWVNQTGGGSTETGVSIIEKIDGELGTDWKNGAQESIDTIQQYATRSLLPSITGNESDVYAMVTSEVDSLNGMYGIIGGEWKMMYHISDRKAPFIRVSPNLIDENSSDFLSGYDIDNTGAIVVDAAKYVSQYIPVRKGDMIMGHPQSRYAFYDYTKTLIPISNPPYLGGHNHGFGTNLFLKVADSTVHYVRIDGNLANIGNQNQVVYLYDRVGSGPSTDWIDYNELYLRDNEKYTWEKEGLIYPKWTNNLYDYKKGDYTGGYTSSGSPVQEPSTGFLPIIPGAPYSHNYGNKNISFWDIDKNFISGSVSNWSVAPSNAYYMSIYFASRTPDVHFKDFQVIQGKENREIFLKSVTTENLKNEYPIKNSICLIGDSIGTEEGIYATEVSYASTMANTFKPEVFHNVSVSGKLMHNFALNINTGAYNMPVADLYIITLGSNDFNFNRSIGDEDDVYPSEQTFWGSLNTLETELLTLNPDAQLVFITTTPRISQFETNVAGAYLEDYVNAVIKFAKTKNHNVIDLHRSMGLNILNNTIIEEYTKGSDGLPDGVHLTNEGHRLFVWPHIAKELKSIINGL